MASQLGGGRRERRPERAETRLRILASSDRARALREDSHTEPGAWTEISRRTGPGPRPAGYRGGTAGRACLAGLDERQCASERTLGREYCLADTRTGVAKGVTRGRNMRSRCRCSMCPAIHINSRSWLRSSSTHEPSDPPHRVVISVCFARSSLAARIAPSQ